MFVIHTHIYTASEWRTNRSFWKLCAITCDVQFVCVYLLITARWLKFKRFLNGKICLCNARALSNIIFTHKKGKRRREGKKRTKWTKILCISYKKSQEGQWTSAFVTLFLWFNMWSWKFTRCTYVFISAISCIRTNAPRRAHRLIGTTDIKSNAMLHHSVVCKSFCTP